MSKKRPRDYDDKLFEILNMTDKLELVSVTSLSGFIFKVTTREKIPKSYIMKIVVLVPSYFEKNQRLIKCTKLVESLKYMEKITAKEADFKDESEIQNYIYNESRRGGRPAICPRIDYAVIYKSDILKEFLSLLDNKNKNSYWFLNYSPFQSALVIDSEIDSVIKCLLFYSSNKFFDENKKDYFFRLGIILMDEIPQTVTLGDFINSYKYNNDDDNDHDNNDDNNDDDDDDNDDINSAFSNIYYQLIYLFVIIGVINFDMYMENALVYFLNNDIKTILIDFGRSSGLTNMSDDKFLTVDEKMYINEIRDKLIKEFDKILFTRKTRISYGKKDKQEKQEKQSKINFIMKTMNILNILCWAIYRRNDNDTNKTIHQMDWFQPIQEVTYFMNETELKFLDDNDRFGYEFELIKNGERIDHLINYLIEKKDYTPDDGIPLKAFDILESSYKTISTDNNKYEMLPIKEKGGGAKKTSKTKRKYKKKIYIKSGKKRSCRKHKRTHIK